MLTSGPQYVPDIEHDKSQSCTVEASNSKYYFEAYQTVECRWIVLNFSTLEHVMYDNDVISSTFKNPNPNPDPNPNPNPNPNQ